jgi:hypothetical protein
LSFFYYCSILESQSFSSFTGLYLWILIPRGLSQWVQGSGYSSGFDSRGIIKQNTYHS